MKIVSATNACFSINLRQVWESPHIWHLGPWAPFGPSPTHEPERTWVCCPLPSWDGLRVWSRCFWAWSHLVILGAGSRLPAAPPQTRARGLRPVLVLQWVGPSQDQRLLSREPGGVWRSPACGAPPSGPGSSDGHRGAVASVLWVPAVMGHSAGLRSSSSGGPESLWWCSPCTWWRGAFLLRL